MYILLVEDDPHIAKSICMALAHLNINVQHVSHAKEADYYVKHSALDLCLLDLGLPDQDGLQLLQQWRQQDIQLPVLVLTARNQTTQCVEALNHGADDYLTKPFELSELIARIHALRRRARGFGSSLLQCADLQLDKTTQQVTLNQQAVALSRREYALLEILMLHPNQVLKNQDLIDKVYGFQESIESNALNVHIFHLRQKLPNVQIQTVRGVGYMLKTGEAECATQNSLSKLEPFSSGGAH